MKFLGNAKIKRKFMLPSALEVIIQQIGGARADLLLYRPHEMDWPTRAKATAARLIPWMISIAPGLKSYVE